MGECRGGEEGERSPTGLAKKYCEAPGNIIAGLIGTNERYNLGLKVNIEILSGVQIVPENQ